MIDKCTLPVGLALGGVSSESRIIADLSDCEDFSIVLGFTRCPIAIVGVSSVDYFFEMLMCRFHPFNPTYDAHLP